MADYLSAHPILNVIKGQRGWIDGTSNEDIIYGSAYNDWIQGNGGNDIINAGKGSNSIIFYTGDGNDIIENGGGVDELQINAPINKMYQEGDNLVIKYGNNDSITVKD